MHGATIKKTLHPLLKANTFEMVFFFFFFRRGESRQHSCDRSIVSLCHANAIQLCLRTRNNSFHQNTDQFAIQLCITIDYIRGRFFNASLCGKVCQTHVIKIQVVNRIFFFHKKRFTYVALFQIKFCLDAVIRSNVNRVSVKQRTKSQPSEMKNHHHHHHHHQHKHQGLDPLIRSVSKVTTALSNVSSVLQLFSFLVVYSSIISKGFGFVAFFASVETS